MPLVRSEGPKLQTVPIDARAQLLSSDVEQRWRAVRDVAVLTDGVVLLAQTLAREPDIRVREAIFTSLSRTQEGLAHVLPYIRSDDSAVRTGALDALRAAADIAEPFLSALLHDPDPDVRLLICEVVRQLNSPAATRLLIELLETEEQVNVCAAAVEILAEVGEPSALPALERCAQRFAAEPFLVFSARVAAQRITRPRA